MGDLISRESVLKLFDDYVDGSFVSGIIRGKIAKLPAIASEQKTGYWIIGAGFSGEYQQCSECFDLELSITRNLRYKFCPICGAKMEGEKCVWELKG